MCDIPGCDKPSKKTYKSTRHTIGVFRGSSPTPGSMLSHQSNGVCEEHYKDIMEGKIMPRFASRFPEMDTATRRRLKNQKKQDEKSARF